MTQEEILAVLDNVRFDAWIFQLQKRQDGFFLNVEFTNPNTHEVWKGRKWYVSPYSTKSEVVQTAFKAVLTALEHEVREAFLYKKKPIFGPHYDVDALVHVCDQKDVRTEKPKSTFSRRKP